MLTKHISLAVYISWLVAVALARTHTFITRI